MSRIVELRSGPVETAPMGTRLGTWHLTRFSLPMRYLEQGPRLQVANKGSAQIGADDHAQSQTGISALSASLL